MARIFVTRELPGPALARLKSSHETTVWPGHLPPSYEELRKHTAGVHALLCLLTDRVDAELIAASPQLRVIANYAVTTTSTWMPPRLTGSPSATHRTP